MVEMMDWYLILAVVSLIGIVCCAYLEKNKVYKTVLVIVVVYTVLGFMYKGRDFLRRPVESSKVEALR